MGILRLHTLWLVRVASLSALLMVLLSGLTVSAHPADEIIERNLVHIGRDGITVEVTISAGAIKLLKVWTDADTNNDKRVDAAEREAFGQFLATGYEARIDGALVPATYRQGSLAMAATLQAFELQAADPSGATVSAVFTLPFAPAAARHEITFLVNHYNAYSNDRPPELYPDAVDGLSIAVQGGNDVDLRLTTAPAGTANTASAAPPAQSPNTSRVTRLLQIVRDPRGGPLFVVFGIVVAVALGAVHALTPGHGKTLMAAYLVGERGSVGRACALGGVITLTHTGSVIALGVLTVLLAGTVVPGRMILWIELVSSVLIIALGCTLLRSRLQTARQTQRVALRRQRATPALALAMVGSDSASAPTQGRLHEHEDGTVHSHGWFGDRAHSHAAPAHLSWKSLIAMGIGGGIIPCPDALAILLVAMAAGHVLLGIVIILGFSVGLAAVLIAIGVLLTSTRLLDRAGARWGWMERVGPWLPAVSAVVIVLLGVVAFVRAFPVLRA